MLIYNSFGINMRGKPIGLKYRFKKGPGSSSVRTNPHRIDSNPSRRAHSIFIWSLSSIHRRYVKCCVCVFAPWGIRSPTQIYTYSYTHARIHTHTSECGTHVSLRPLTALGVICTPPLAPNTIHGLDAPWSQVLVWTSFGSANHHKSYKALPRT